MSEAAYYWQDGEDPENFKEREILRRRKTGPLNEVRENQQTRNPHTRLRAKNKFLFVHSFTNHLYRFMMCWALFQDLLNMTHLILHLTDEETDTQRS